MRERTILWDILVVLLLVTLVAFNGMALMQNSRAEKLSRATLLRVQQIQSGGFAMRNDSGNGVAEKDDGPRSPSYFDGSSNPKFPRGDDNADDGDTLVINESQEPNSLNPVIDSDATGRDLYDRAMDKLADTIFEDITKFEPKLARAWEKAMICRAVTVNKNAKELAEKLNKALPAEELKKLKIEKISAESDEILRIELFDTSSEYRDPVVKLLGEGAIEKQSWIYIGFENGKFTDKSAISAKSVGERARKAMADAGFKGRFLPDWEREGSVAVRILGGSEEAEKALHAYIDSPAGIGEVTDPKSVTGTTSRKALTLDLVEHYIFEEKPVFTFFLRKNVKWHDGMPFTGKDVVFSYKAMMDPEVESASVRNYYQDCESVELVDNDLFKVRFTWRKPYFQSFGFSAELPLFAEHDRRYSRGKEFNESGKNQKILGTGPYIFEKWDRKQQLTYVRNENYWGKKPHFTRIICKFVKDDTVSYAMLRAGELDLTLLRKPQAELCLKDENFKKNFGMEISVANSFAYCGWNMRNNLFKGEKTRRAMTMALDRQQICDKIMRGFAIPTDIPAHPQTEVWPKAKEEELKIPLDVAGAKRLLAEDGWKDTDGDNVLDRDFGDGKRTPFKFTLKIPSGSAEYESIANLMQDSYAQIGIVVTIQNLEWSVLVQSMERLTFDAIIAGWRLGTANDPYQLWHSSQTGEKASNHCGFVDKKVDELIERGRTELDPARRLPLFHEVFERIARAQPYTCLFIGKRTIGYDKRIQNVVYTLQGKDIMRWWVPKEKQKVK